MANFTLEVHMRVYDDSTGDYFEIKPDPDGLDLVELSAISHDGHTYASFTMPLAAAVLFSKALQEFTIRECGKRIKESREKSGDASQG
jgi:hypothetical protein